MTTEEQTSTALVKVQPVPRDLAAVGVKIAQDEASGMQIVVIPDEVRQRANVLMPVQAFQQADPYWTPSLRMVQLNPSKDGPHFYKQAGNKLAPTKQALELLADGAGVVSTKVWLVRESVEWMDIGGIRCSAFEHRVVLALRRSDGTLITIERSKNYEPSAEYEEIRDSVTTAMAWENGQRTDRPKFAPGDAQEREIRKRWLAEIKNAKAKNESKAVLRAIRAALEIPHTFTEADARKPFLVVGWNFTPPDTPEVRAGIASAIKEMYGASAVASEERPALEAPRAPEPVTDEPEPVPAEMAQEPMSASEKPADPEPVAEPEPTPEPGEEPAEDAGEAEVVEEPEPEPVPEETPDAEEAEFEAPVAADADVELANAAGALIPPAGMFAPAGRLGFEEGLPLEQILDYGDGTDPERGRNWIGWALRNWKGKTEPGIPVFYEALTAFAKVHAPDLLESAQ